MASNLLGAFVASNESMAFQNGAFFAELVAIVDAFRARYDFSNRGAKEVADELTACIKKNTNLNTFIRPYRSEGYDTGAEVIFQPFPKSAFVDETANLKKGSAIGTVDTKRIWVEGLFAKINATIAFPQEQFIDDKFTAEEVAAVILHEVGHVFTICILISSYVKGFQAYRDVVASIEAPQDYGVKKAVIFDSFRKHTPGSMPSKAEIDAALAAEEKHKDGTGIASLVFVSAQQDFEDMAGPALEYQGKVFEQMADQFAARMGAGAALATYLGKTASLDNRKGVMGGISRSFGVWVLLGSVASAIILPGAGAAITGGVVALLSLMLSALGSFLGNMYDPKQARVGKIANEYVAQLKNFDLPPAEVRSLLAGYEEVKAVEAKMTDAKPWLNRLVTALVPPFKRRARFNAAMVDLERLASNDLYVRSQQFKLT